MESYTDNSAPLLQSGYSQGVTEIVGESNNGWIKIKSEYDLPKEDGWYRTIDCNSRYVNSTVKFDSERKEAWLSSFSHWKQIPREPLPFDLDV